MPPPYFTGNKRIKVGKSPFQSDRFSCLRVVFPPTFYPMTPHKFHSGNGILLVDIERSQFKKGNLQHLPRIGTSKDGKRRRRREKKIKRTSERIKTDVTKCIWAGKKGSAHTRW